MLRSRIFWKLLLAFAALNVPAAVLLVRVTNGWLKEGEFRNAESQLNTATLLLAAAFVDRLDQPEKELSMALGRLTPDSRLSYTLLAAGGDVLATTSSAGGGPNPSDTLAQNEASRPEVAAALADGVGFAIRDAYGGGAATAYYARRVSREGPVVGVVRASLAVASIEQQTAALHQRYLSIALGFGVAMIGVAYAIARQIATPVQTLGRAADAIAAGDYRHRVFVPNNDELGVLAKGFNRMGREIDAQLTELRESAQQQATVLGGMIEGVIAIDDRQWVLFANAAAGRLFDFVPPQVEGRPLLEVIRHHALSDAVAAGLNSGRPQRLELEWEGVETLQLSTQVTPLPGDPCPGAVVVLHDTTELRRLEALRREFVANVSHELKTPLSSIKAYAETLINGAVNDEEHRIDFLRRIEEQADRLNNLIQDMLSLARIESDQQPFSITRVVVADVVDACLKDHQTAAEAKRITLVAEPGAADAKVKADPEGLRVILNNLVDNAIKYTPNGGGVTLRWSEATGSEATGSEATGTGGTGTGGTGTGDNGARIALEVVDTGVGIPESEVPRVFERFYRVDKARSQELGGTGLGLSIVKHLVQSFGGVVSVQSQPDKGTTFRIELPAG